MSDQPNYQEIIARLCRQLQLLSPEQRSGRLAGTIPNIPEMVGLITKDLNATPANLLHTTLNDGDLFHLGQLVILVEILVAQNKKPKLVRWFE
ncbi:hypothetical protein Q4E93_00780 [Flavitalea sp. BT771]|uniref:hypothetical protein n=1 Tax=Flavitalea sp. BT771 TaxID=3063329 RepID=UPI0026E1ED62|nr:hypothetical protein [Flavitalea sp. BT771]MDO6429099.1 hypothetical protein [Flavitalea sp. BT771]MDV6218773.1 hypothetical protein [Flavitalea sp. BT771]